MGQGETQWSFFAIKSNKVHSHQFRRCNIKDCIDRGAWVAQSVKRPTGSGHDLAVREFEPRIGLCADSSEPGACFRFCVSLYLTLPVHALFLSVSKINKR